MHGKRAIDRVRGLSRVALTAPQILGEQTQLLGQALETAFDPDFFVLQSRAVPQHEFEVVRGKQLVTDELRFALAAGFWPGPPGTASPLELLANASASRFVAVSMWGEDAPGPWDEFWRQRSVRYGLYGVFFSPRGRIGVVLMCRGPDDPPFEPADVAFVQACAPYVEAALDMPWSAQERSLAPAERVHARFDAAGSIAAISFRGQEFLRDLGGGQPGAVEKATAIVEEVNRRRVGLSALDSDERLRLSLAGEPAEREFRASMFDLSLRPESDPDRSGVSVILADNGFGRFRLDLSTLVGLNGELERIGVLTRYVSPLLLRLRGALQVQATGRELELLSALSVNDTLTAAAESLDISKATARTLGDRLARRIGERNLMFAADKLLELGRGDLAPAAAISSPVLPIG